MYYYWHLVSEQDWKLDSDPVTSAKKYISENESQHNVSLLNIEPEPGTEVVAFKVVDFVREWAVNTQELAMDSTCERSVV